MPAVPRQPKTSRLLSLMRAPPTNKNAVLLVRALPPAALAITSYYCMHASRCRLLLRPLRPPQARGPRAPCFFLLVGRAPCSSPFLSPLDGLLRVPASSLLHVCALAHQRAPAPCGGLARQPQGRRLRALTGRLDWFVALALQHTSTASGRSRAGGSVAFRLRSATAPLILAR